jgi:hypothetical protein
VSNTKGAVARFTLFAEYACRDIACELLFWTLMEEKQRQMQHNSLMKIILLTISLYASNHVLSNNSLLSRVELNVLAPVSDTSNPKLEQFKQFVKIFFASVKANDAIFLKKHIVFPIPTSSFSNYDRTLIGTKVISSKTFFKKIHKLIPDELINWIDEAEYSTSEHAQTAFYVILYSTTGGVDSNCSWEFMERGGEFYFKLFTAEAG